MKQIKQAHVSHEYLMDLITQAHKILFEIASSPGMQIDGIKSRSFTAIDLLKEFKDTVQEGELSLEIKQKYF